MAKFSQLVAVVLIGAVLGGTQCVELCSFLSGERQAQATQAPDQEMPCHQQHSPQDSQPPASDGQCTHHELVSEQSKASSTDVLQTVCFVSVLINAQIVPVLSSSPLTLEHEPFPKFSPPALTSVLRI